MPPIVQGQIFPTLADFKLALRNWAIERNWTPHILDSDAHRVRAGCRSGKECPFRIRANYSVKRGDAKVTTCDDKHTCEPFMAPQVGRVHQPIKRAETGKLKFLLEAVPKLMTVTLDTNITEIINTVERSYGQKIPTRQAQKVKSHMTDRVKGPCRHCHQLGHTRRLCPILRAKSPDETSFNTLQQQQQRQLPRFEDHGEDDGTFADGGLEMEPGHEARPDTTNHPNGELRPLPSGNFGQPYHVADSVVDPSLEQRIRRLNSCEAPVPIQPAIIQTRSQTEHQIRARAQPQAQPGPQSHDANRSAKETRLEAARLMQQAAALMQEAARLNSEAARLTAQAANEP